MKKSLDLVTAGIITGILILIFAISILQLTKALPEGVKLFSNGSFNWQDYTWNSIFVIGTFLFLLRSFTWGLYRECKKSKIAVWVKEYKDIIVTIGIIILVLIIPMGFFNNTFLGLFIGVIIYIILLFTLDFLQCKYYLKPKK